MQLSRPKLIVAVCLVVSGLFAAAALRGTPWGRMLRTEHLTHQAVHIVSFGVLAALLVCWANSRMMRAVVILSAFAVAYLVEYFEHVLGHFPIESADVFTDVSGVVLGAILTACVLNWRSRSMRQSEACQNERTSRRQAPL